MNGAVIKIFIIITTILFGVLMQKKNTVLTMIEYAKTLVFYTKKDLERDPVRLKPGDTFNINRRKKD